MSRARDGPCGDERDDDRRDGEHGEGDRPGGRLLAEPPLDSRARERRQDDEPDRRRGEGEHDEHAVRGEEPVRLRGAAELARDDHADDGREPRLDGDREGGHRTRRERPMSGGSGSLAHRRGSLRPAPYDPMTRHDLDRAATSTTSARSSPTSTAAAPCSSPAPTGSWARTSPRRSSRSAPNVHAFVRATSSGALNNIGHLRRELKVHFADLTDRTSIDYLVRELCEAPDRPYVFHLGAQAHVGESWHRPYETVMANTVGTLNLLQSIVDWGLELEKFDTAGTSEEYGNVRDDVTDHHTFDDAGALILHERSPINPKSIYATAKVAADFLTMNYYDAFGLPGVVTRMFNNYGPRQNPRYVTGHDHHAGAHAARDRARRARPAARLLLLHRRRPRPPDRRRARAGRATSTSTARARTSRWPTGPT